MVFTSEFVFEVRLGTTKTWETLFSIEEELSFIDKSKLLSLRTKISDALFNITVSLWVQEIKLIKDWHILCEDDLNPFLLSKTFNSPVFVPHKTEI